MPPRAAWADLAHLEPLLHQHMPGHQARAREGLLVLELLVEATPPAHREQEHGQRQEGEARPRHQEGVIGAVHEDGVAESGGQQSEALARVLGEPGAAQEGAHDDAGEGMLRHGGEGAQHRHFQAAIPHVEDVLQRGEAE